MKRFISLLLVCLLAIPFGIFATVSVSADTTDTAAPQTIYLSDTGADTNDGLSADAPVKTISRAYALLGDDGGTISIVGTFTQTANFSAPEHTGTVTITGNSADSKMYMSAGRRYFLGGPTVFDDIVLDASVGSFYVICLFNQFTATENFSVTGTEDVLLAVASQSGATDFGAARNVEITLNGGRWTEVIGGMRQGLGVSGSVTKTTEDFKDYNVTFNIGGSAVVSKFFALHRTIATSNFIAPNSSCTINLNGGVVTHFICHNDQKARAQGYENGLTVNIGPGFDLSGSFDAVTTVDPDTRLDANKLFYGITALSAYDASVVTAAGLVSCNTLVIDDSIYDSVMANNKIRFDDFAEVKKKSETLTPIDVYISDNGVDTNNGLSADAPVRTITHAYKLLKERGGRIIIVDTFTQVSSFIAPDHEKSITIEGADPSAVYTMSKGVRFFLGGETVFNNLTIDASSYYLMIVCNYNDFTATETVEVTGTKDVFVVAGGQGDSTVGGSTDFGVARDVTITLKSGRWSEVIGGMRQSLTIATADGDVTKTADDFKDHNVTINVSGDTVIGKLFAFNRSISSGDFVAPNSSCTVNLDGGTITHFLCHNDQRAYCQGYENGLTVRITKNFDLEGSFDGVANIDPDTRLATGDTSKIYYGLSPQCAYDDSRITASSSIECNTLIVDDEIYDRVTSDKKIRLADFAEVVHSGSIPGSDKVVYISNSGASSNDGLTPETPIKSITTAYHKLGAEGGTIVVVGSFTHSANFKAPTHTGTVVIKGYDSTAQYVMGGGYRYYIGGPTAFDNITLDTTSGSFYLICLYNAFTATDTFAVTGTKDVLLGVGGQKDGYDFGSARDVAITLNGGRWTEVFGVMRGGLTVTGSVTKTADNFKDHDLVFNIGGNVTVSKLFAFHRSTPGNLIAPNSSCTVNLNGGVITHFICHNDQKAYVQGFENGLTVNIADTFDISASFDGVAAMDPDTRYGTDSNMVFYGISPKYAYHTSKVTATGTMPANNVLVIADGIYDTVMASGKTRNEDFWRVVKASETDNIVIYLSDSGDDTNDGLSADTAVKTLARAYALIGANGGTIVITGTFTQAANFVEPAHTGKIYVTAEGDGADYVISKSVRFVLAGETEFSNLHIKGTGTAGLYIICNFNSFKVADTVTVTGSGTFIINLGAQSGVKYTAKDATLVVEGGHWSEIIGAARQNLNTGYMLTENSLKGVDLEITIDKNASVDKVFGFVRNVTEENSIVPDGTLRINLLGGQINNFLCQTDRLGYTQGMLNGMTVYIGKNFDISKSFTAGSQDENHYVSDGAGHDIFYGLSGESAYNYDHITAVHVNRSVLIIASELYNDIKDNSRIRTETFLGVIEEGSELPAPVDPDRTQYNTVYVSDTGHDFNNGRGKDTAVKTVGIASVVVRDNGTLTVEGEFTLSTAPAKSGLTANIPEGTTLYLNVDAASFAAYTGNGTIVVADGIIDSVTVDDFFGFKGSIVDKDGNNIFSDEEAIQVGSTGDCQFTYDRVSGLLTITGTGSPAGLWPARWATEIVFAEGVTAVPVSFCLNNTSLEKVTLASTIKTIDTYAFQGTSNLKQLVVAEDSQLETIKFKAFLFSGITAVDFNDNLKTVEGYAFRDCHDLVTVDLGTKLETLSEYAFARNFALSSITFDGTFTAIADNTFLQCGVLESIVIPETVTVIGTKAFMNATRLASVDLPANLTTISTDAFKASGIAGSITLPETVTVIGDKAFYECGALTGITLPEALTSFGSYCFFKSGLTTIVIPSQITEIPVKAFDHCADLTTVTVNGDITAIGNYAFAESRITSFVIPETCTTLGNGIFYSCSDLAAVTIEADVLGITSKMFYNCTALTNVNIPETVVNIHPYAFYNCSSLAEIELPEGLKMLQDYAFANTSSLTGEIAIPGTVKEIGEKCFMGSGVTSVTFGDGVITVLDSAFMNTALTDAYLTKSVTVVGDNAFSSASGALVVIHTEADAEAVIAWAQANTDKVTLDTTYVPVG